MSEKLVVKNEKFDFQNVNTLLQYLDDQKRILPNHVTELSLKQQRQLTKAVKRARVLGLLPFTVQVEY